MSEEYKFRVGELVSEAIRLAAEEERLWDRFQEEGHLSFARMWELAHHLELQESAEEQKHLMTCASCRHGLSMCRAEAVAPAAQPARGTMRQSVAYQLPAVFSISAEHEAPLGTPWQPVDAVDGRFDLAAYRPRPGEPEVWLRLRRLGPPAEGSAVLLTWGTVRRLLIWAPDANDFWSASQRFGAEHSAHWERQGHFDVEDCNLSSLTLDDSLLLVDSLCHDRRVRPTILVLRDWLAEHHRSAAGGVVATALATALKELGTHGDGG